MNRARNEEVDGGMRRVLTSLQYPCTDEEIAIIDAERMSKKVTSSHTSCKRKEDDHMSWQ